MLAARGLIIDMMRGVVNMQLFYFPENFFLGSFPYFFFYVELCEFPCSVAQV